MSLIAPSELLRAFEKYQRDQAGKVPSAFVYKPRTKAQWRARADQTRDGVPVEPTPRDESQPILRRNFEPEAHPAPPIPPMVAIEPVPEADESEDESTPAKKIAANTICLCGHRRDAHCTGNPRLHAPEGAGAGSFCIWEHCDGQLWVDGVMVACPCEAFRVSQTDTPKMKHPKADDYTPCANPACGHWRGHHCKKRQAPKAGKRKRKNDPHKWEGFAAPDGQVYRCKHVNATEPALPVRCSSTSCAEENCACEKFVNPLARPRAKAATPRKSKKKVKVEMQMKLFASGEIGLVGSAP